MDILSGAIAPGEKLPSKRALAEHLGVSAITVEYAYRQLMDEGYVYARERSGYFVRAIQGMSPRTPGGHEPLRLLLEDEVIQPPQTRQ